MPQRSSRTVVAAMIGIGFACAACSSTGNEAAAPPPAADDVRVVPVIAPVERPGLEVAWWITHDPNGAVGPALRELATGDQRMDAETADRLRLAGIRAVRLTDAALLDLTVAAPPIRGIERLWIGLAPQWTAARLPPPMDPTTPRPIVPLGASAPPGALRLLVRSYLGAEQLDPVLRVDLLGQVISPSYARDRFSAAENRLPRPIDAGPTFDAVRATMVLRPGEVVVLIADAPEADWSAPAAAPGAYDPNAPPAGMALPAPPPSPELLDADDQPSIVQTPSPTITPALPPRAPPQRSTFGQAMLTTPVPGDPSRPGRLVMVLIPQVPAEFEIIPRSRAPR